MAYTWDGRRGRYLDDGDLVPADAVRAALRTVVTDSADRLAVLAERFRDGRLDVIAWREAVRQELRTSYGVAASLAQGGVRQMGPSERGVLSGVLREQYGWLDQFALDATTGRVDPQSDAFLARARLYAGQAHQTYEVFARRGAEGRGHTQERNVLGTADHCAECQALTARGWVPLGSLPLPGSRTCLGNCACTLETGAGAEVAA
jgi:hypothetical protein